VVEKRDTDIPFLDAARAFAALLGIVLHAAAGYLKYPIKEWPSFNVHTSFIFDMLAGAIHIFRVPVFFFLAGVVSYLLLQKVTVQQFTKDRFHRIGLPFLFFICVIHLPNLLTAFFSRQIHSMSDFINIFSNVSFLWFLEYLLIYYVCLIVSFSLIRFVNGQPVMEKLTSVWAKPKKLAILMISLNFIYLYFSHTWLTPTLLSIIPDLGLLSVYSIYFVIGLLIAHSRNFNEFFVYKWQDTLIGIVSYGGYIFLFSLPHQETHRVLAILLFSITLYFFFINFMAICHSFFSRKNKIISLLAKASYWIYLSQFFFMVLSQHFVSKYKFTIYLEFALVMTGTIVLCLASYFIYYSLRYLVKARKFYSLSHLSEKAG
jgi:glucan biosynthesis protein C